MSSRAAFSANMDFYLILLFIYISTSKQLLAHTTEKFEIVVEDASTALPKLNKTIDKLVEEQTELIKKIVSAQKPVEYPIVTREEVRLNTTTKEEREKQSIEDLKRRCEELSKGKVSEDKGPEKEGVKTVEAFGPIQKPEFLAKRNQTNKKESAGYIKYFLVTRNRSEEATHDKSVKKPKPPVTQQGNVKYVQLEPVILQKTVLSNGQMLYYWLKNVPMVPGDQITKPSETQAYSTFQYPSEAGRNNQPSMVWYPIAKSPSQNGNSEDARQSSNKVPVPLSTQTYFPPSQLTQNHSPPSQPIQNYSPLSQSTQNYFPPSQLTQNHSPPSRPTQNYSLPTQLTQNYSPISQLAHNYSPISQSTQNYSPPSQPTHNSFQQNLAAQKPPAGQVPRYEVEYNGNTKMHELLYRNQLKFILPMPQPSLNEEVERAAWQVDPYAYYPKVLQPSYMNLRMPYSPSYHMIRTLVVPEKFVKTDAKN